MSRSEALIATRSRIATADKRRCAEGFQGTCTPRLEGTVSEDSHHSAARFHHPQTLATPSSRTLSFRFASVLPPPAYPGLRLFYSLGPASIPTTDVQIASLNF